jgi:glycosyltransferase involved in cell wall biosynthesis
MHIVFLTVDCSSRSGGGIATYVHTVASALARRGHRVTVVSPKAREAPAAPYASVRIRAAVAPQRRRVELANAFSDAVLALHRETPVHVVEATDYGLEGFACAADRTLGDAGIRTVVRMHTPDSMVCELNGEIRLTDSPAVHAVEPAYFRRANHVSSPSRAMVRELGARFGVSGGHVTVLPNPVEVSPVPAPPVDDVRRGGRFLLTYFGRLERRKGAHVLAEALTALLPERPELHVAFVGADTRTSDGAFSRALRRALAPWGDRVRFAGFLEGEERVAALRAADAVCMPSLWENFPYACLEALAHGRPVVATSGSGFEEILGDGMEGLLVPPEDPASLATAIAKLMDGGFAPDPAEASARAAAFDAERLVPRFERYYAGLAA